MKTILTPLLLLSILWSGAVFSNDDVIITERSRLENTLNELTLLQQFIDQTQHSVKRDQKTRFNYRALNQDIDVLKGGIQRYLNQESTRPNGTKRMIAPLNGEYAT